MQVDPRRVLVVDANKENLERLCWALNEEGIRKISRFCSTSAAISYLELSIKTKVAFPSIAFVSLSTLKSDENNFIDHCRSHSAELIKDLPVWLIHHQFSEELHQNAQRMGADGLLRFVSSKSDIQPTASGLAAAHLQKFSPPDLTSGLQWMQ